MGKAFGGLPWKGTKPKGVSGRVRVNRAGRGKGLPEGSKPRSRGLSVLPEGSPEGSTAGEMACGFIQCGNVRDTFRKGNTPKGESPGAPSARNKAGAGPGGINRQEGNQTLKAARSGCGKPASSGPPFPVSAEGRRSPGEVPRRPSWTASIG
jgi:hypothetical protein